MPHARSLSHHSENRLQATIAQRGVLRSTRRARFTYHSLHFLARTTRTLLAHFLHLRMCSSYTFSLLVYSLYWCTRSTCSLTLLAHLLHSQVLAHPCTCSACELAPLVCSLLFEHSLHAHTSSTRTLPLLAQPLRQLTHYSTACSLAHSLHPCTPSSRTTTPPAHSRVRSTCALPHLVLLLRLLTRALAPFEHSLHSTRSIL